jgi:hypothetical protein
VCSQQRPGPGAQQAMQGSAAPAGAFSLAELLVAGSGGTIVAQSPTFGSLPASKPQPSRRLSRGAALLSHLTPSNARGAPRSDDAPSLASPQMTDGSTVTSSPAAAAATCVAPQGHCASQPTESGHEPHAAQEPRRIRGSLGARMLAQQAAPRRLALGTSPLTQVIEAAARAASAEAPAEAHADTPASASGEPNAARSVTQTAELAEAATLAGPSLAAAAKPVASADVTEQPASSAGASKHALAAGSLLTGSADAGVGASQAPASNHVEAAAKENDVRGDDDAGQPDVGSVALSTEGNPSALAACNYADDSTSGPAAHSSAAAADTEPHSAASGGAVDADAARQARGSALATMATCKVADCAHASLVAEHTSAGDATAPLTDATDAVTAAVSGSAALAAGAQFALQRNDGASGPSTDIPSCSGGSPPALGADASSTTVFDSISAELSAPDTAHAVQPPKCRSPVHAAPASAAPEQAAQPEADLDEPIDLCSPCKPQQSASVARPRLGPHEHGAGVPAAPRAASALNTVMVAGSLSRAQLSAQPRAASAPAAPQSGILQVAGSVAEAARQPARSLGAPSAAATPSFDLSRSDSESDDDLQCVLPCPASARLATARQRPVSAGGPCSVSSPKEGPSLADLLGVSARALVLDTAGARMATGRASAPAALPSLARRTAETAQRAMGSTSPADAPHARELPAGSTDGPAACVTPTLYATLQPSPLSQSTPAHAGLARPHSAPAACGAASQLSLAAQPPAHAALASRRIGQPALQRHSALPGLYHARAPSAVPGAANAPLRKAQSQCPAEAPVASEPRLPLDAGNTSAQAQGATVQVSTPPLEPARSQAAACEPASVAPAHASVAGLADMPGHGQPDEDGAAPAPRQTACQLREAINMLASRQARPATAEAVCGERPAAVAAHTQQADVTAARTPVADDADAATHGEVESIAAVIASDAGQVVAVQPASTGKVSKIDQNVCTAQLVVAAAQSDVNAALPADLTEGEIAGHMTSAAPADAGASSGACSDIMPTSRTSAGELSSAKLSTQAAQHEAQKTGRASSNTVPAGDNASNLTACTEAQQLVPLPARKHPRLERLEQEPAAASPISAEPDAAASARTSSPEPAPQAMDDQQQDQVSLPAAPEQVEALDSELRAPGQDVPVSNADAVTASNAAHPAAEYVEAESAGTASKADTAGAGPGSLVRRRSARRHAPAAAAAAAPAQAPVLLRRVILRSTRQSAHESAAATSLAKSSELSTDAARAGHASEPCSVADLAASSVAASDDALNKCGTSACGPSAELAQPTSPAARNSQAADGLQDSENAEGAAEAAIEAGQRVSDGVQPLVEFALALAQPTEPTLLQPDDDSQPLVSEDASTPAAPGQQDQRVQSVAEQLAAPHAGAAECANQAEDGSVRAPAVQAAEPACASSEQFSAFTDGCSVHAALEAGTQLNSRIVTTAPAEADGFAPLQAVESKHGNAAAAAPNSLPSAPASAVSGAAEEQATGVATVDAACTAPAAGVHTPTSPGSLGASAAVEECASTPPLATAGAGALPPAATPPPADTVMPPPANTVTPPPSMPPSSHGVPEKPSASARAGAASPVAQPKRSLAPASPPRRRCRACCSTARRGQRTSARACRRSARCAARSAWASRARSAGPRRAKRCCSLPSHPLGPCSLPRRRLRRPHSPTRCPYGSSLTVWWALRSLALLAPLRGGTRHQR